MGQDGLFHTPMDRPQEDKYPLHTGISPMLLVRKTEYIMGKEESKRGTAEFVKTTLFKQGGFTYRIPSLLYLLGSRTYLAFAEKRTSPADQDTKCLVIRRMTTTVDPTQKTEYIMENEEPKSGTAEFVKTTLFKQEGGFTYRIPSLLYLPESRTYLAFAEKRTSPADHDTKCLVIRRMTTTVDPTQWSSSKELYEDLKIDQLPNHRNMNPCPVYDSNTQTVFLFYISVPGHVTEQTQIRERRNQARLCCVSSSDQGATWGVPRDLTESVFKETLSTVSTFAVGPGHGVQLAAGRLVVPAYAYIGAVPHVFSIHSDDGVSEWQKGQLLDSWSNECEMAEVIDGENSVLCCNIRTGGSRRLEAQSTDGGDTFHRSPETSMLVETGNGCEGSIIAFPAPNQPEGAVRHTWLAFSHPTDAGRRRDLGVSLNQAPLQYQWGKPKVIHHGPSGYSDLAYNQDDQRISCLLECGEHSEIEQIAFMSFTLDEIMQTPS